MRNSKAMRFGDAVMQAVRSPEGSFPPSAEEMGRARQVQARLLYRRTPRLDHLEYGGCYLPARGIGGHYYGFLHLGLGRIDFALGDVSGKGIPAAVMRFSGNRLRDDVALVVARSIAPN